MTLLEARNIILWEEVLLRRNGHCLQNVPEFGSIRIFHFIPEYCSGYKCIPSTQNIDTSETKQKLQLNNALILLGSFLPSGSSKHFLGKPLK